MKAAPLSDEAQLRAEIKLAREAYVASQQTRKRLWHRFLDGIASGFGIAIGGTVIFGLAIYIATRLILPLLPQWLDDHLPPISNNR